MVVALVAAAAAVAPAIGATELGQRPAKKAPANAVSARFSSGFTPSAADPRLAAVFARGGLDGGDVGEFRFTPAETRQGNRAVTVAVRARSNRVGDGTTRFAANAPTVGIAPIAYNLGAAIGWQRFAVSGDISRVDVGPQPGSRESTDVAVSYSLNRFTGRVKASAERPLAGAPNAVDNNSSYAIDVGGSYSLTRNIDLTAGLRYKSERERLTQVADDRRDSQAVYVGTAFRF
ncbi:MULTISPECIES: hypothetical protein [unclassified Sphingomonas]|uniref:hypothetical protein n=1 Tax=unclassified Sphingomonas TaxID=196159 RepID=UPI0009263EE2|nr:MULTISPECIES: hypothetical protein [unclassified Sphingomonas]MBN8849371.1 hypothetical protein [Sphingomonas sp.]OJV33357.1 MAG: hypothetical protein BGO24_08580 [Sphingomonas sp. 67-36]